MVKQVDDYVAQVQEKYPFFTQQELNKILTFGLNQYAFVTRMQADILLCHRQGDPMLIHCGAVAGDALMAYRRFIVKCRMRERALFFLRHETWDGYYYIGLTDEEQKNLVKIGNTVHFKNVYLTKLKKELHHNPRIKHIWRIPLLDDLGWRFFREELTTKHAHYIGETQYEKYHQCFLRGLNKGHAPSDDTTTNVH